MNMKNENELNERKSKGFQLFSEENRSPIEIRGKFILDVNHE